MGQPLLRRTVLLYLWALAFLCASHGARDECTSGFMSLDRMDNQQDNEGLLVTLGRNRQAIFPEVLFSCSGSISGWVFAGTGWSREEDINAFSELQIWRPSGDGTYAKIGHTTITGERNHSRVYYYMLSSPLAFQAGDILGYHQPNANVALVSVMFERNERRRDDAYFYYRTSPASELEVSRGTRSSVYHMMMNMITDSPDCVSGLMSVERIGFLLGLETPDRLHSFMSTPEGQYIAPRINFTCNGWLTKWIIGVDWYPNSPGPELQVWRKTGNETYRKIHRTEVYYPFYSTYKILEHNDFAPIPVRAGDVLGIYIPRWNSTGLRLRSEVKSVPGVFRVSADLPDLVSPYEEINTGLGLPTVQKQAFYPFVSVEFARDVAPTVSLVSRAVLYGTSCSDYPLSNHSLDKYPLLELPHFLSLSTALSNIPTASASLLRATPSLYTALSNIPTASASLLRATPSLSTALSNIPTASASLLRATPSLSTALSNIPTASASLLRATPSLSTALSNIPTASASLLRATPSLSTALSNIPTASASLLRATPSLSTALPNIPTASASLLRATPSLSTALSNIPTASASLLRATPSLSTALSNIPTASASLLRATPSLSTALPNIPTASASLLRASPSLSTALPSLSVQQPAHISVVSSQVAVEHSSSVYQPPIVTTHVCTCTGGQEGIVTTPHYSSSQPLPSHTTTAHTTTQLSPTPRRVSAQQCSEEQRTLYISVGVCALLVVLLAVALLLVSVALCLSWRGRKRKMMIVATARGKDVELRNSTPYTAMDSSVNEDD